MLAGYDTYLKKSTHSKIMHIRVYHTMNLIWIPYGITYWGSWFFCLFINIFDWILLINISLFADHLIIFGKISN